MSNMIYMDLMLTPSKAFLIGGMIANFLPPTHTGSPSVATQRYLSAVDTLRSSCLTDLIVRRFVIFIFYGPRSLMAEFRASIQRSSSS